jgi:hypothetical protein
MTAIFAILATICVACSGTAPKAAPPIVRKTVAVSPPGPRGFILFQGLWAGGGRGIMIRPDGRFVFTARTFVVCGQNPPPCDTISGNHISDGANASGQLTSASGDVAKGNVIRSTDSSIFPDGRITIILDPATDVIYVDGEDFCGDSAPGGTCGA